MISPFFQYFNSKKLWVTIILLVFLIPTYFIHTQKYPDWGDDFAQYVYQSQQINKPSQNYKQVLNIEEYSSPKRSVFFSVVLSIVKPTLQIQKYVDVISVSYIFAGLCFFFFLSKYFSLTISFIGTLCVFYNFLFLRLKSEVVPEFIFIALFYGVLSLSSHTKHWIKCIIPVLLALLVSVRFVGLSLVMAHICFLLLQNDKMLKQKLKELFFTLLVFIVVIACINICFLNSVHNQEVKLYGGLVLNRYNINVLYDNVSIYIRYLPLFFEQEVPYWVNILISVFSISFICIGFIISFIKQKSILHFTFIFYFLFLFFYPYNGDTIKYLIPIIPLVFYFMIVGLEIILKKTFSKSLQLFSISFLSLVFLSNSKTIWMAIHHVDVNINPYETSVLQDFETIKKIVPLNKSIAFGKPFIINLLADRDAYFLSNNNYSQVFSKANYVLSAKSCVQELYPKIKDIPINRGDTTELTNFYLIKL